MITIDEAGKTAIHIIPYGYLKEYPNKGLEDDYVVFEFVSLDGNWLVDDMYMAPPADK